MSGWDLYYAWVDAQTAQHQADLAYAAFTATPEAAAAEEAQYQAEGAAHDAEAAEERLLVLRGIDPHPDWTAEDEALAADQENRGAAWSGAWPGSPEYFAALYGPDGAAIAGPVVTEIEVEAG